jgi:CheY-like chemotaxis protein
MPLVPTRVLIVNRQIDFAVTVKRSLEQLGGYEVAPFTGADTALDYARTRPHDVALVDFTLRGISGGEIIEKLREIQPDIAIIATPKNAETQAAMRDLSLQEVVDTPMPVRQLIPVLERAVKHARETLLPDTVEAPSMGDSQTLKILPPEFTPLDKILQKTGGMEEGVETIEVDMSDLETPSERVKRALSVFEQLAAEEPPMPGVEDNATVGDLRNSLLDTSERAVVQILSVPEPLNEPQPLPPDDGDDPEAPILARKILEETLDHTSSLKALVEEVAPESPSVKVAAAMEGVQDEAEVERITEQPVAEVEPVGEEIDEAKLTQMALDLTQASLELTAEATLLSRYGQVIASAGSLPKEDIDQLVDQLTGDWSSQSRIRFINLPSSGKDYMLFSRRTTDNLVLTLVFAGNMPLRVIRRQSDKLMRAMNAVPEAEESIMTDEVEIPVEETLPEDAEAMPNALMADNLANVEKDLEYVQNLDKPPQEIVPAGPLTPFSFVWLVRDPDKTLPDGVAQAIIAGMDLYLTQEGWTINTLRVHEDYIYLYGAVPGERPANEIIQELKVQSAQIAAGKDSTLNPEALWADAYFALLPGRELDTPDIQRFIRFGRMAR